MDCHVFRRLCDDLCPVLLGGRIEKIYQPGPDLIQITVYTGGRKQFLLLKAHRNGPFLFLSAHKRATYAAPPADIMRLRKHLSDRRIVNVWADWAERRLFLRVSGEDEVWLILDLRTGARLQFQAPEEPLTPCWPDIHAGSVLYATDEWRNWAVLTPPLRRTLPLLPPEEQAALLLDLEAGGGDLFVYEDAEGNRELSAWPLPPALRLGREELAVEDALRACAAVGETQVLRTLTIQSRGEAAKPHFAEMARLKRVLLKLDSERERLTSMAAAQVDALALQACLYQFSAEEKRPLLEVETEQGPRNLILNPRLTLRENMAALFHRAGRGKRGLALLEGRFSAVRAELAQAEHDSLTASAAASAALPGKAAPSQKSRPQNLPKNVQAFRSSDGFVLLRGRDAKGNAALLKLASGHDLWMHTGGGPGAHVLVRRDHATQEIPQTTLEEAATLAVLKSWRKDAVQVDVIAALAKFVHPVRGGQPGAVKIDKVDRSIVVTPRPEVEEALSAGTIK